jgi:hypothetical protein
MRNAWWITLTAVGLVVGIQGVRGDEPATLPDPAPPAAAPVTPEPIAAPTMPAPQVTIDGIAAPSGSCCSSECSSASCNQRCPRCGRAMSRSDCGCCTECGKRQMKVARFLDWLVYVPLDHGKTKCCGCQAAPPPAWAFFPCHDCGQGCACAAANQETMYYAKEAGKTTTNQVVQTAYPPKTAEKPSAPPAPPRVSSFNSQAIQPRMPVLDPSQFQKPATGN